MPDGAAARGLGADRRATSTAHKLAAMTTMVPFAKVFESGKEILAGKVRGRVCRWRSGETIFALPHEGHGQRTK